MLNPSDTLESGPTETEDGSSLKCEESLVTSCPERDAVTIDPFILTMV